MVRVVGELLARARADLLLPRILLPCASPSETRSGCARVPPPWEGERGGGGGGLGCGRPGGGEPAPRRALLLCLIVALALSPAIARAQPAPTAEPAAGEVTLPLSDYLALVERAESAERARSERTA